VSANLGVSKNITRNLEMNFQATNMLTISAVSRFSGN